MKLTVKKSAVQLLPDTGAAAEKTVPAASLAPQAAGGKGAKITALVFGALGLLSVMGFLVIVVLQFFEMSFYGKPPSLWLGR
jgi:hypothetical protein